MLSCQSEIEVDLLCAYGKRREIVAWDVSTLRESACERTWLTTNATATLAIAEWAHVRPEQGEGQQQYSVGSQ